MLQLDLTGKVVLITGVSSGIGAGVALMFARAGASVSGCDLGNTDPGFMSGMIKNGKEALYTRCDMTVSGEQERLVEATLLKFGRIDILVSNAGKNFFHGAEACSDEQWAENINLNLTSHWKLSRLCRPSLEISRGVIIIITSNHAFSSIPGCFPYNVAKTALTGLVRSMAMEWGPAIRTVGLAPGFIDTPGNQQWFDLFADPELERQKTIDLHPVRRIGTVEEVGAWCVFLASSFSAFASGTTYLLDGGRSSVLQDS